MVNVLLLIKERKCPRMRKLAKVKNREKVFIIIDLLDNWLKSGIFYGGYPVKNKNGNNVYHGLTLSECQELCEITDNCFYFNYVNNECYLKYGVGTFHKAKGSLQKKKKCIFSELFRKGGGGLPKPKHI